MPFNGSGAFSLIFNWQQDALNGINISSSRMMGQENDIAAGLSLCITKDGQQTPTASLPMGGFRLTNMGNANSQGNAVSVQDVQNGSVTTLTSVSGADTITANTAPSIGSYAAGQCFDFIAAGANATGVVTLNINGLGAKAVTKYGGQGIQIGDIASGQSVRVRYDGTQFQMISPASAVPTNVGGVRNLSMYVSAVSATATLTADEIVVRTALGGPAFVLPSFSKTINLATNGAGGMDTGSALAAGYVALYAIYNPTTGAAALLAANANAAAAGNIYGGANMPSGYTASALLAVWPTAGANQFSQGLQQDREFARISSTVLNTITQNGSLTSLSIAAAVPLNAKSCGGSASFNDSTTATITALLATDANGLCQRAFSASNASAAFGFNVPFDIRISTAQTIFWAAVSNGGTLTTTIIISRYSI